MASSKRVADKPFSQSITIFLDQKSRHLENIRVIQKFQIIRDHRRAPTSFLVMQISLAFSEEPTPFPRIPFDRCTFAININNQHVNFRSMNIFSI